jgi:RNA polymerase sigma-70 factor (ECF subfamily)
MAALLEALIRLPPVSSPLLVSDATMGEERGERRPRQQMPESQRMPSLSPQTRRPPLFFVEHSRRHSTKLLHRTYRMTRNWQDAEDVLQESFLKAFIHLKDFEERSSFASWLTQITINSALMILRKKRGHPEISIEGNNDDYETQERREPRDLRPNPESRCVLREREQLLEEAVLGLPVLFREVVQLRQTQECSVRELAEALGISVAAAKSRLSRAKTALRMSLCGND